MFIKIKKYMLELFYILKKEEENILKRGVAPIISGLVYEDKLIKTAFNKKNIHGELFLLNFIKKKKLKEESSIILVNLEPCPSCAYLLLKSQINILVFGAYNEEEGAFGGRFYLPTIIHSKLNILGGFFEKEFNLFIKEFFQKIREKKKNSN